jgi:predicted Zn-dependent protease
MTNRRAASFRTAAVAVALLMTAATLPAQSRVEPPNNKYSPADDVELGRQAAAEVEKQSKLVKDDMVTSYVNSLGRRLVSAIPSNLQEPAFHYTFKVVDTKDVNAFALPGGPVYVNRGMIEAARTEGELAGVLAHEISHVALRHGTAQATKATPFEFGALAGAIAGAIIGGQTGQIVSQGTQIGLGTYFLKYSRAFESQADLEGAQIMARAGYDPRQMADMFDTLEQQNGGGGIEFLSDHPNPGNRREAILQEAQSLKVSSKSDVGGFDRVQARLGRAN